MKPMYLFFLAALLLSLQNSPAIVYGQEFSAGTSCTITALLKIGSKGDEVLCLQGKLGVFSDGKFGPLTKTAVINFQSGKGLVPDGVVGTMTRAAFNNIVAKILPAGCTETMKYNPMTGKPCYPASVPEITKTASPVLPAQKPKDIEKIEAKVPANLTNLDKFIDTVVAVRKKKGATDKELELIAKALREEVLKSDIDYNKKFEEMLEREAKLSSHAKPALGFLDKATAKILSSLGLAPTEAYATTGVPFGGMLLYPFFCSYSYNWMIILTPLPPSYAYLLSYTPFTQGFASYNIPYTRFLLGSFVPPGECVIPAYPVIVIPTEGNITSMTGSSPQ